MGVIDRPLFDASKPRLIAFDAAHAEPTAAELATPIGALTPKDWEPRLTDLISRALRIEGRSPESAGAYSRVSEGGWRVIEETPFKYGPKFADALHAAGVPDGGAAPAVDVFAIASRVPLAPERIAALRAHAAARPTVLVGLQNDFFLEQVPEAALRLSAADCTPLTRRVVAERLAALRRGAKTA